MNRDRRSFLALALAAATPMGFAQQARRLPRVAIVVGVGELADLAGPSPVDRRVGSFLEGMRDNGLVEGTHFTLERRSAEGRLERIPVLLRELVAENVDVIVTGTAANARAAQQATSRIPIVAIADLPLEEQLIASLPRPGGNLTGIGESVTTYGKALQLLKEAAPSISRLAVVGASPVIGPDHGLRREIDAAAKTIGVRTLWLGASTTADLDALGAFIERERVDALMSLPTSLNFREQARIAKVALSRRVAFFGLSVRAGALISYGMDVYPAYRRAAGMVRRILEGVNPGELPFEHPNHYVLRINLSTARALGLTLPASLLQAADEMVP